MKRFFSFSAQSVGQASKLLAITALLSNVLGLARNLVFYRVIPFGELDVYFASFRIADFIFNLLIFGAITSAVIPTISELLGQDKEKQAWKVTNQLLSWGSVALLTLTGVLALFMPQLVRMIIDFDPERTQTTIFLSRLLLLQTLFFSWSFIIGALLNAYSRFASYAFAPLVYNASLIIGGLLAGRYGLVSLVYAVVIGSFLHFLIQFSEARKIGFKPRLDLSLSPAVKKIFTLMLPRSLSQGMGQIVLIVYTSLASGLQRGSLAVFSGMNDLQTTPTVVVANSLATASFPAISLEASKKNWQSVSDLVVKLLRIAFFLLIPMLVLGLVMRAQIVRLYAGTGTINWELTTIAIATFAFFLIGIIPNAIVTLLARVFYATKDTRTPMVINIITSLIGIAASIIGIRYMHSNVSILALSESLIAVSQALLYLLILRNRHQLSLPIRRLLRHVFSYSFGAIASGLAAWGALQAVDFLYGLVPGPGTERIAGLLTQAIVATTVGVLVYFLYSTNRSREELSWLRERRFSTIQ